MLEVTLMVSFSQVPISASREWEIGRVDIV